MVTQSYEAAESVRKQIYENTFREEGRNRQVKNKRQA